MSNLSYGMNTDRYEFTMLDASLQSGMGSSRAVFEVFSRSLDGWRYGVAAGLPRVLDAINNFKFSDDELRWLVDNKVVGNRTANWLADYHFTGNVAAYREGELYFPNSPIVRVEGTFAECVVLETIILSILNFDSMIANKASRIRTAAKDKLLIEMGTRRGHEQAALQVARSAYLAGFDFTSNLAGGMKYNIPTVGTSAHAFTMAYESEVKAFRAQIAAMGHDTTLLVDTYDIGKGVENASAIGGFELAAIRIDSGDLGLEAKKARRELNAVGGDRTKIVLSGDLDEFQIQELLQNNAPADSFGVGTRLLTEVPSPGFVYKLVAIERNGEMVPVAKKCNVKATVGGRKYAYRKTTYGHIVEENLSLIERSDLGEVVQVDAIINGEVVIAPTLVEGRELLSKRVLELPDEGLCLELGKSAIIVKLVDASDIHNNHKHQLGESLQ